MKQAAAELLNAGADPNIPNNATSSHQAKLPLEMAVKNKNITICRLLLIAGAKPEMMSSSVKGKDWLEGIALTLRNKSLLSTETTVDFTALADDRTVKTVSEILSDFAFFTNTK